MQAADYHNGQLSASNDIRHQVAASKQLLQDRVPITTITTPNQQTHI
jgi:hypothetical protein